MKITEKLIEAVRAHAAQVAPQECCGLVVVKRGKAKYHPCRNISRNGSDTFIMDPDDYAAAEDYGTIAMIVHSHPFANPKPSMADIVGCESSGVPWLIVNHPLGHYEVLNPTGYKLPLLGREFTHGVLDCYSLVADYYTEALKIEMPHFDRNDDWWNRGENLYVDNFASVGFVQVSDAPREHDAFLMQIRSPVPNHAAVYIGNELIMHHMYGRLSSRDVYGGYWQKATVLHLRHRSQV